MKAQDVIIQLYKHLPLYTDYFTDQLSVTGITSVGTTATVTTSTPYNLSTGDNIHISGALVSNPIATLTQTNGIASGKTQFNHDLTMKYRPVEIIGANEANYNGSNTLLSVPNRQEFTFAIDDTTPSPATGAIQIIEELNVASYNGWHSITVVDANNFTYQLARELRSPAVGNIKVKANPRISGGGDLIEIMEAYTARLPNELWAFVIVDILNASKDRSIANDNTGGTQKGSVVNQIIIQRFHVYVFIPRTDAISTRPAKDLADDLLAPLCNVLIKFPFPHSSLAVTPDSGAVFVSSGLTPDIELPQVYINDFIFEQSGYIDTKDAFIPDLSVAFRDIDAKWKFDLSSDNLVKMEAKINLDEKPLP